MIDDQLRKTLYEAVKNGWITKEEAREQMTLKPIPMEPKNYTVQGTMSDDSIKNMQQMIEGLQKKQESVKIRDVKLDEGEMQMLVMALAHLAVERPGWKDGALRPLAEKLGREELFDQFFMLHDVTVNGEESHLNLETELECPMTTEQNSPSPPGNMKPSQTP